MFRVQNNEMAPTNSNITRRCNSAQYEWPQTMRQYVTTDNQVGGYVGAWVARSLPTMAVELSLCAEPWTIQKNEMSTRTDK